MTSLRSRRLGRGVRHTARAWERRYGRKLLTTDIVVVFASVFGAQLLRFGFTEPELGVPITSDTRFSVTYTLLSVGLGLTWLAALAVWDTRDPRIFGIGPSEYKRVISSTLLTFGLMAIFAYAARADIYRGYVLLALPAGLFLLVLSRWLWRQRLHNQRRKHRNGYRTLIVGERAKSRHVAREIANNRIAGFTLLGAVTDECNGSELLPGLPVVADYDSLLTAVDELGIDTLIMTSTDSINPGRMRQLGWDLERREVDLVVTAALTDIAGSRIHTRPVAGLPLIHVEHPVFKGRKQFAKRAFDIVGSLCLIVLSSPLMLAVALAVKLTSRGPIFYSQERIGLSGAPFPMLKFRSMVDNADAQLKSLLDQQGTADKPLHKVENDPRITPVGQFIRRYSLDELPQLFNVLLGSMSLVGPRPQRDAEVALYLPHHHRRLLMKPGITGLWQVSGRSNIDWEDAIRLDLYYVENWSMTGDLVLLWKTVRAVIKPEGAY